MSSEIKKMWVDYRQRKVYFGQADGHVSPAENRRLKLGWVSGRTAAQREEMVNQEWVKRSPE